MCFRGMRYDALKHLFRVATTHLPPHVPIMCFHWTIFITNMMKALCLLCDLAGTLCSVCSMVVLRYVKAWMRQHRIFTCVAIAFLLTSFTAPLSSLLTCITGGIMPSNNFHQSVFVHIGRPNRSSINNLLHHIPPHVFRLPHIVTYAHSLVCTFECQMVGIDNCTSDPCWKPLYKFVDDLHTQLLVSGMPPHPGPRAQRFEFDLLSWNANSLNISYFLC